MGSRSGTCPLSRPLLRSHHRSSTAQTIGAESRPAWHEIRPSNCPGITPMNEKQSPNESLDPMHPGTRRRRFLDARRALFFGVLLLGLPAIVLAWIRLKEPSRPPERLEPAPTPEMLAADRQR